MIPSLLFRFANNMQHIKVQNFVLYSFFFSFFFCGVGAGVVCEFQARNDIGSVEVNSSSVKHHG